MNLAKTEFRDSLRLRYNIPLQNIPRNCPCGKAFSVDHALCCKKGGFISARHDKLRNLLAGSLKKICNNVEVEPQLTKIDNELFRLQTTSTEDDARLDIKASDFRETGQTTFLTFGSHMLTKAPRLQLKSSNHKKTRKKESIWKELSRWRTVSSRHLSSVLTGAWEKNAAFFSNN